MSHLQGSYRQEFRKEIGPLIMLGEFEQARPAVSNTLQSELILVSKEANNSNKFQIPKRLEALAFFNRALIQYYLMSVKLDLDKSWANDWNDQLKENLNCPVATTTAKLC